MRVTTTSHEVQAEAQIASVRRELGILTTRMRELADEIEGKVTLLLDVAEGSEDGQHVNSNRRVEGISRRHGGGC